MKRHLKTFLLSILVSIAGLLLYSDPVSAAEVNETADWRDELEFGQEIGACRGAPYYESASQNGSGRRGYYDMNVYTSGKTYIAGFAKLDEEGNILEAECYSRDAVPVGKKCGFNPRDNIWLALYVEGFTTGEVGWMRISNIVNVQPDAPPPIFYYEEWSNAADDGTTTMLEDEVTPDDVASAIEQSSDSGKKVALLLDASGSVQEFSAQIAEYANKVNKANKVLIFASDYLEIRAEEYMEAAESIMGLTEMYAAMNAVSEESYDTVIIVTDTYQNGTTLLKECNNIDEVIIVSVLDEDWIDQETIQEITNLWHVEPQIVRLVENYSE